MVGLERSILPLVAARELHLVAQTAVLSFILVVGVSKALTNYAAGRLAARYGLRPQPFFLGIGFVVAGLVLSAVFVRETRSHATLESYLEGRTTDTPGPREVFWRTSLGDRNLSAVSQAGLVNNLNDGMVWGLLPVMLAPQRRCH